MEHKIGSVVTLPDGRRVRVVEDSHYTCNTKCALYEKNVAGCLVSCMGNRRSDHKNVIYKEIKEDYTNKIVYLGFKRGDGQEVYNRYKKYINNLGSLVSFSLGGKYACVTTTMNCLKVNGWEDDLDYKFDEPTYHQKPNDLMLNYYKEK